MVAQIKKWTKKFKQNFPDDWNEIFILKNSVILLKDNNANYNQKWKDLFSMLYI